MHQIRNFHEGHSTVGEWQGNGMLCVNRPLTWQGNGMLRVNRPLTRQGNGMLCVNRPLTRQGDGMLCVNRRLSSLVLFSVPAVFHVCRYGPLQ
jgi:hypothetical protein